MTGFPLPRPDILAPAGLDQNTGTAEILRLPQIRSLVKGDFIVLPCDLICELGGEKLLQAWMVQSASLADKLNAPVIGGAPPNRRSGGLGVFYSTKGPIKIKNEETDFIATTPLPPSSIIPSQGSIIPSLSKLVYSIPTDSLKDLTEERKSLPVRHGLLRAHPRVKMLAAHRDAHIYIFPNWILDFIQKNEALESIGEDVVGWWAKSTWQSGLAQKLHMEEICGKALGIEAEGSQNGSSASTGDRSPVRGPGSGGMPASSSIVGAAGVKDGQGSAAWKPPSMLAYVQPAPTAENSDQPLIRRVDTAQLLLAISLQLAKLPSVEETGGEGASPFAHAKKIAYPEGVKSRTTITKQDSLLAENVTVEEKTSIKETVIGANCQISEGAKLAQCLLMEGVVVGKGCKLTRCILGKRCVIGANTTLTDCEVQENLLVEAQSKYITYPPSDKTPFTALVRNAGYLPS